MVESLKPHPDRDRILNRLLNCSDDIVSKFDGSVFRFVDPQYSSTTDLFVGKGSLYANGRWLVKGNGLIIYTSLQPETSLAEALSATRYYGFPDAKSTPIVLVTAAVKLGRVIDLRDGKIRQKLRIAEKIITGSDWRAENLSSCEAVTQAFGWAFFKAGIEGLLVPSAGWKKGANLIAFPTNLGRHSYLKVIKEVKWPRI